MTCPKCGAILEEDAKFCVSCGAHLEDFGGAPLDSSGFTQDNGSTQYKQSEQPTISPISKEEGMKKFKANIPGLVVGTLIIVIGLIRVMGAGTSISATSFGGDFYTYTYQGIVAISEILASIEQAIGWLTVAVGAAIDVVSLKH